MASSSNCNINWSCGRVSCLSPQLAGIIRFGSYLPDLFNPTSGRDASHMCLISLSPRHMCTTTTQCGRVSCISPQLEGIVCFGSCLTDLFNPTSGRDTSHMCLGHKLIRHMWEASLPNVGLNKSVRHEPKRTIPAN